MNEEYIPRDAALSAQNKSMNLNEMRKRLLRIPAADVVPVVRCRDCIHGRFKHQDMYECLKDADIDKNTGVPYGFIDFHEPDFFCAYGEKEEA